MHGTQRQQFPARPATPLPPLNPKPHLGQLLHHATVPHGHICRTRASHEALKLTSSSCIQLRRCWCATAVCCVPCPPTPANVWGAYSKQSALLPADRVLPRIRVRGGRRAPTAAAAAATACTHCRSGGRAAQRAAGRGLAVVKGTPESLRGAAWQRFIWMLPQPRPLLLLNAAVFFCGAHAALPCMPQTSVQLPPCLVHVLIHASCT